MFEDWYVKIKSLLFPVRYQERQAGDLLTVRSLPVLENPISITRLASVVESRCSMFDLNDPSVMSPGCCSFRARLIEYSGLFPEWADETNPVANLAKRKHWNSIVIVTCPGIGPPSSGRWPFEVVPDLVRLDLTRDLKDQH